MSAREKERAPVTATRAATTDTQVTSQEANQLQVKFPEAAKKIRHLHESVVQRARDALKEAIEIGGILTKVKQELEHGEWLPWLTANVPFDERTAQRYMSCHANRARLKNDTVSDLTDAYRLMAGKGQRAKTRRSRHNGEDADKAFKPKELKAKVRQQLDRLCNRFKNRRRDVERELVNCLLSLSGMVPKYVSYKD